MLDSGHESLVLSQNWFDLCDFKEQDTEAILTGDADRVLDNIDGFNAIGAYLVDFVGLDPNKVEDWFLSETKTLGFNRPIDLLKDEEGFDKVFKEVEEFFYTVQDLARIGIGYKDVTCMPEAVDETNWGISEKTKQAVDSVVMNCEIILGNYESDKANIVSTKDGSVYLKYINVGEEIESYYISYRDGSDRNCTLHIIYTNEPDSDKKFHSVELSAITGNQSSIPNSEQDRMPAMGAPPNCYQILKFSKKLERLHKNNQLELVK